MGWSDTNILAVKMLIMLFSLGKEMHFVCNISLQSFSKFTPTLLDFKYMNKLISQSGTYYEKKKLSSIQLVIQKYVNLF